MTFSFFFLSSKIDGLHVAGVMGFVSVVCFDDNVFDTNGMGGSGSRWKRSMAFCCPLFSVHLFLVDLDTKYSTWSSLNFISFSPVPSLLLYQSTIHPIRQSPVLKFVLLHLISSDDRLLRAAVEIDIDQ
jgi:hypothetical protein